MKITEDLLRRYSIGQCTPQEIKFIEKWLASQNDAIPPVSEWELADAKVRTWNKLSSLLPEEDSSVVPLYKRNIPYAAAACLLIVLASAAYFVTYQSGVLHSEISIATGSNITKHVLTPGIELTLFSESDATVKSNITQAQTSIELCGKMEMNIEDEYSEAEISSVCNGQKVSRKISLEKGNKYFVFTENNKVMLVDYKALRQMREYEKNHMLQKIKKLKIS